MDFTKIGKNINKLMLKSGMSMREFGWVIGYPSSTICRWVNGNAVPKSEALYMISKRFGVIVDSLFDRVDKCTNTE